MTNVGRSRKNRRENAARLPAGYTTTEEVGLFVGLYM